VTVADKDFWVLRCHLAPQDFIGFVRLELYLCNLRTYSAGSENIPFDKTIVFPNPEPRSATTFNSNAW
jgi:hypothetical protein